MGGRTEPTDLEEEDDLAEASSVILPQLQELEKEFFDVVASGNVNDVQQFLETNPRFDVNATNFQGVTALHIAVQNRNVQMVEYLLAHPDIEPGDTHLHAIRNGQSRIAIMILDKLNELAPGMEFAGVPHSADFLADTTPMAVAAQYGHFELLTQLRRRGHTLERPHSPNCNCEEKCKIERETQDLLTIDKMRLLLYRAISNPAYICQTTCDPILEAFILSAELSKAASFDKEFFHDYKMLSKEVSQFATDLISCARRAEEVEIVLKQTAGFACTSKFVYPRLLLALDYKQKGFVAHPNVQQVFQDKWIGEWYEWKIKSIETMCLRVIIRIFELPVMLLIVPFAPGSRRAKFWATPVNKLISYVAGYLVFLGIVFYESYVDKREQLRGPPHTGVELPLAIYVVSYMWAFVRLCVMHGMKRYFRCPWVWYEAIMLSLFLLTFVFWIAAAVDVRMNGQRDLERKYWYKYDPTLVGEGIFCLATIMAFLRILFFCQLNYHLGPLQLSLGKMIRDVGKFIVLFAIIISAFTAGLCRLYNYYNEMVQVDDEYKIKTQQASSFVDLLPSFKTLFWAIFCMSPIESADVIIENLPGETDTETIINHHKFTEFIGYIAFAAFEFISVVVVLNMLIACMSDTLSKVTDNVIVEWTFGRSEVYVDFMLTTTLPPPLNIIPTLSGIRTVVEYVKVLIKPPSNKRARWDIKHCCYIEDLEEDNNEDFAVVMGQLVQRYFRQKNKECEEVDVEELRKELKELRSLLREALAPE